MMSSSNTTTTSERRPLWLHGLAAAVAAAAVTTGLAYVASKAGVSFADPAHPELPPIPPLGFTELTLIFSLIGVGLAAILARTARRPRSTFVRTALALLALSVVPDFVAIPPLKIPDFDTATGFTLAGLHVVAAAIVIPVLAGRLAHER
jgi:hypothetical protein